MSAALFPSKRQKGFSAKTERQRKNFLEDLQTTAKDLPFKTIKQRGMVAFFGSHLESKDSANYALAQETAYTLSCGGTKPVICTGGGPGIMTAALEGAHQNPDAIAIGIQTYLLAEKEGSAAGERLQVHTIQARKLLMMADALALIFFPGGPGTLDELMEVLTLKKLGQIAMNVPIILMGDKKYWEGLLSWKDKKGGVEGWLDKMARAGMIKDKKYWDRMCVYFAESPQEARRILDKNRWVRPHRLNFEKLADRFRDEMEQVSEFLKQSQGCFAAFFGSAEKSQEKSDYAQSAAFLASEVARLKLGANGGSRKVMIYTDGYSGIGKVVHDAVENAGGISFGNRSRRYRLPFLRASPVAKLLPPRLLTPPVELMCSRKTLMADAKVQVVYPGGPGTLNEVFEYIVRINTGEMKGRLILLMYPEFWKPGLDWLERGPIHYGYASCDEFKLLEMMENGNMALKQIEHAVKKRG